MIRAYLHNDASQYRDFQNHLFTKPDAFGVTFDFPADSFTVGGTAYRLSTLLSLNSETERNIAGITTSLEKNMIATVGIGGIAVNDAFPAGTELENIFRSMLAPYVAPSLNSISIGHNPSGTYFEAGQSLDIINASLSWNADSEGNQPVDMYISGPGFNKAVTVSNPVADGGASVQKNTDTTQSWTFSGKDKDNNNLATRSYTRYWRWRWFFGASATELTGGSTNAEAQAVVDALQQSYLNSGRADNVNTGTYNATAGNYTYIAYAAKYGDLSGIIQDGALPVLGAFTKVGDFSITNTNGVTETYRVYKSNADAAFANGTQLNIS